MSKQHVRRQWPILGFLAVVNLIASPDANAVGMSFSGTLIAAPKCTMTENPIDIKFGLVDVVKVHLGTYEQPVEYSPKCEDSAHASSFYVALLLKGGESSFNAAYLATDNDDLAIKVWDGSTLLQVNRALFINDQKRFPVLKAVLMKRTNASLGAGKFSATATLVIEVM